MKILIYSLGGGWGHLTRAAALANALGPNESAHILTNSPYSGIVQSAMPDLAIEQVSTREEALAIIDASSLDILIVDTFPRGLGGELAQLLPRSRAKKILIHRDLSPAYIAWAAGLREFVADQYDLILCPGESGPFADLPQARATAPWLVRAPIEIDSPAPVIVCASGNSDELEWYGEVASLLSREVDLRCLAPDLPPRCPRNLWIRHWPAIDWISAARVAIGSAGYNTVSECLATGTPLIARPWPRKYDRQRERAARSKGVIIVETASEAASAALKELAQPAPQRPNFINGATDAARWILRFEEIYRNNALTLPSSWID